MSDLEMRGLGVGGATLSRHVLRLRPSLVHGLTPWAAPPHSTRSWDPASGRESLSLRNGSYLESWGVEEGIFTDEDVAAWEGPAAREYRGLQHAVRGDPPWPPTWPVRTPAQSSEPKPLSRPVGLVPPTHVCAQTHTCLPRPATAQAGSLPARAGPPGSEPPSTAADTSLGPSASVCRL